MEEVWRDVVGYEGKYSVSNTGCVIAHLDCAQNVRPTPLVKKPCEDKDGYLRTGLSFNGKSRFTPIHRIVAKAFIPNPDNLPQINHIDGNKHNNRVENLEWCTARNNVLHNYKIGLHSQVGMKNAASKLDDDTVRKIKMEADPKRRNCASVARKYGVSTASVSLIINNKMWPHIQTQP